MWLRQQCTSTHQRQQKNGLPYDAKSTSKNKRNGFHLPELPQQRNPTHHFRKLHHKDSPQKNNLCLQSSWITKFATTPDEIPEQWSQKVDHNPPHLKAHKVRGRYRIRSTPIQQFPWRCETTLHEIPNWIKETQIENWPTERERE